MPIIYKDDISIFFFHIPKCAGTSIEKAFVNNDFLMDLHNPKHAYKPLSRLFKCSPQHYHYNMVSSIVDLSSFDYCFTVIRDPIDRLISEYKMRAKHHVNPPGFNVWLKRINSLYKKNPFILDNHIRPQSDFIGGEVKVFDLSQGLGNIFNDVERELGITLHGASHSHASHGSELSNFSINKTDLNEEDFEIIENLYSSDMELFE
ncbi:sulfotransferase family 2 domain-containing protein [Cobetia sp. UIB-001]|uniref:sulfotransferase family 2 domain-containing protein n=1 Tax=Cobetia sp. UIB-001 TaxID=2717697 RepID=UPI00384A5D0D